MLYFHDASLLAFQSCPVLICIGRTVCSESFWMQIADPVVGDAQTQQVARPTLACLSRDKRIWLLFVMALKSLIRNFDCETMVNCRYSVHRRVTLTQFLRYLRYCDVHSGTCDSIVSPILLWSPSLLNQRLLCLM